MYIITSFSLPYALGFANVMCSNNTVVTVLVVTLALTFDVGTGMWLHLDKQQGSTYLVKDSTIDCQIIGPGESNILPLYWFQILYVLFSHLLYLGK